MGIFELSENLVAKHYFLFKLVNCYLFIESLSFEMAVTLELNCVYITLLLFDYVLSSTSNNSNDWDYRQEGNTLFDWIDEYPECGYNYQSPINIDIIDCNNNNNNDESIYLEWSHHSQHYAVRNNGHSLQAIPFQVIHEPGGELSFIQNVLHHTNETKIKLKNPFYNTYKSPVNSGII